VSHWWIGLTSCYASSLPTEVLLTTDDGRDAAPTFTDFDRMVKETRPDTVTVTTVDSTHARYIIRAMELGCNVMSEKPLCADEQQCQAILDAQKKTGKKITVTFNARHGLKDKKVKELLMQKAIGDVISIVRACPIESAGADQ
jgi:predicted dehydrogenase